MHTHQWVCTLLLGPSIRQSKLTVFATIYVQQILAFFPLKVLEVLANLASCFGFFRLTRKSAFFRSRETSLKGMAHSWYYPSLDHLLLKLENIIHFLTKRATPMRRSTVLSLPLQLVFPGPVYQGHTLA